MSSWLTLAAEHGHVDVGRVLVRHGADVEAAGRARPLFTAIMNRRDAFVAFLVESGADMTFAPSMMQWRAAYERLISQIM
jgi:ankyrin repeat protein